MRYPRTDRQAAFMARADRLAAEFATRAERHDRDNTFPHENFRAMHESGHLALSVPAEYGGAGADPLEVALAQERLARGDGSTALASTMHLNYVGKIAQTRAWPEPLLARVCRDVVENGALINSAHSEPELGSPSRGGLPTTTARRVPGGWVLNGHKRWSTLAPALTWADVLAAASAEGEEPRRATFLVRTDTSGVRVLETWDNLGMRATGSHDLLLEDVFVPEEMQIQQQPAPGTEDSRGWGPLATSAVYLGIAGAARDAAIDYARNRRPPGLPGPIAELPAIQARVAEMELLLETARRTLWTVAEDWVAYPAERNANAWQLAVAKYTVGNNAIRITDLALRIAGSAGLMKGMPLERYFRDVRTSLNQPPIDDAALTQIARTALGL